MKLGLLADSENMHKVYPISSRFLTLDHMGTPVKIKIVCIFIPKWIFFMRIVTFYGILVICSVCIHSHINIFSCRLRMVTFYDILVICSMCIHSHINIFMWMVTYYGILFICSMNIHSHHADGKKRSKLL